MNIPQPAINRLCIVFKYLDRLQKEGIITVSSSELGEKLGIGAHNVRKDISHIGGSGNCGGGYDVAKLKKMISDRFGFENQKAACVVGLGRIGLALLENAQNETGEFKIVAGFDSNINKIETIKTSVRVFPAYQITEMVRRFNIEYGIIAVPLSAAQETADRLVDGGIKGIINFVPTYIKVKHANVFVKNIDIDGEMRILSALIKENTNI